MCFFIIIMLIEAEFLPQGPQFASNIPRFGEEPDKLTKMLPEPNNTILMSEEDGGLLGQKLIFDCIEHALTAVRSPHKYEDQHNSGEVGVSTAQS